MQKSWSLLNNTLTEQRHAVPEVNRLAECDCFAGFVTDLRNALELQEQARKIEVELMTGKHGQF